MKDLPHDCEVEELVENRAGDPFEVSAIHKCADAYEDGGEDEGTDE